MDVFPASSRFCGQEFPYYGIILSTGTVRAKIHAGGIPMASKPKWDARFDELDDFTMGYEVAAVPFFKKEYVDEFYRFYRIRDRHANLIPCGGGFHEALRDFCGDGRWEPISEKTEALFGRPARVCEFDDISTLKEELGGPRGLSSFFFVFDLIFCEYPDFTLCFIFGTNN